ncbi:hypothetical protein LOTGIDRAFT_235578 [Lottia gigantea]|uniref:Uncharacterized protein n=1 Tax=Lottia gigantea TaxID=225164 RepID=V3ZYC4_LOTGI|nr:hypothetical protein LOTGIDRAFT_235578 [Lottia gigantea]ESO85981.1 hypothetical protein LOTGIDRAFT_235578 [Lottia gigantea]
MSSSEDNSSDDCESVSLNDCSVDGIEPTRNIEKKNDAILQFLAIFSFSLFIGLFILQANIAWRSYQNIYFLTRHGSSEEIFDLYLDSPAWGLDMRHVDLKVNTSIFVR